MLNEEHIEILKQGIKVWERWRYENPDIRPELYASDLSNNDWSHYNFDGVNLFRSNLEGSDLTKCKLKKANLSEANLKNAIVESADLEEADLSRAICVKSDFSGSNLHKACLSGTNFNGANISQVDFREADFSFATLRNANVRGSCLSRATFNKSQLQYANLDKTRLDYSVFVNTSLENASIKDSYVYGISTWDLELQGSIQSDLVITPNGNPYITVDNIEVAQFIYLLLNNQKIRNVIDTITSKVVLILGRFTPERKEILDTIKEELKINNYLPVLFDFDKPVNRDTHETVTTLARLSKFVIADITDPKSVPQELLAIVQEIPSLPVQPFIECGCEPWGMYDHIKQYKSILDVFCYKNKAHLIQLLKDEVIRKVETKLVKKDMGANNFI